MWFVYYIAIVIETLNQPESLKLLELVTLAPLDARHGVDVLPDGLDGPVQLLHLVHRLKAVLVLGARVGVVPLHGAHHVVQDRQELASLRVQGRKTFEIHVDCRGSEEHM